jgi:hypothetical protein
MPRSFGRVRLLVGALAIAALVVGALPGGHALASPMGETCGVLGGSYHVSYEPFDPMRPWNGWYMKERCESGGRTYYCEEWRGKLGVDGWRECW